MRLPNGWYVDKGIIPKGLPTGYTGRAWRDLTHESKGHKTGSGCDALCGGRSRDGNSGSGLSSARVRKAQTPAQRTRRSTVRSRILSR